MSAALRLTLELACDARLLCASLTATLALVAQLAKNARPFSIRPGHHDLLR
jgi:hypothetical protein